MVTTKAAASEKGAANQIPFNPIIKGNIIRAGNKKINCRVKDKKIAFLTKPIDWKKLEATTCNPTKGKTIMTIRKPTTVRSISDLSEVKALAINSGASSAKRKPTLATTSPHNIESLRHCSARL